MQVSCPNCATNFSVPDKALGAEGRTLKCAKCGHRWFQTPAVGLATIAPPRPAPPPPARRPAPAPAAAPPARAPTRAPAPEPPRASFNPVRDPDPDLEFETPASMARAHEAEEDLDFEMEPPPVPNLGPRPKADGEPADLDLDSDAPQPIPTMFANKPDGKKGTGGLWLLLLLLLLGGAGGAGYYFQDRVVDMWPPAHKILADLGLRHEKPGTGLELRNAGTPERFVHNNTEVLIVRGIIANVSDRERPVPTMKLVLLDRDRKPVQEKLAQPPVNSLDPGGTAGFRIILERPDPNATEVNVLFVDAAEAAEAAK
ncbi:DUF3426 domain-containing protein [Magnetospirillum sp. UT-4]|uniref:DUF3426 domain-containing protein n=1 Tax=Magnetospirillum sp. UT-4 TaxID=2681467 RepID=UPI0013862753|nr:DUF3426 domain-containing protein [Magnetospirillum sp. UT-4]CAA7616410.1 conserved hypothetical protein [Magnetospirillum sp. UT-4]